MEHPTRIAVLTSGGDAQGMNAAVRAVVRGAILRGAEVYAVEEGYEGMVRGGDLIRPMRWSDVGGIMHQGGTVIGTARSEDFRTRPGRLRAARNLLLVGIDRLVVVGGDGSLTGASTFRSEWADLLAELVATDQIPASLAERHPALRIAGMVGSIDNDMAGTDMTIGADTALHRILEAIDAINSTAASHQRSFVVEVMGRNCGYLALRSAIAGGCDWALIPESPPEPDWEDSMTRALQLGRARGRRDSIVVVAEGATDHQGDRITAEYVRGVLEERLGEDTRVTVLGHVQRGGRPSAFDRSMSTQLGVEAVDAVLGAGPDEEPQLIGLRNNRITRVPLMPAVDKTHSIASAIKSGSYDTALELRGGSFLEGYEMLKTLTRAEPSTLEPGEGRRRIGILHAGAPAPGMNSAVRVAVRLALDQGHEVLGFRDGFDGVVAGDVDSLGWMSVNGWMSQGGALLGVARRTLSGRDLYAAARTIEDQGLDALLMIGGWDGYVAMHRLVSARDDFPAFNIPMVCVPASIDNNLPGSEVSIGADTALNSIMLALDRIKQSAVAAGRTFVVEVMGNYCGYLALMSGLASGAERVFLNEDGISLGDLQDEVDQLRRRFGDDNRLSLVIRNEHANPIYTTEFLSALFTAESGGLFSVREAILGHLQQGGDPSPFDRILAARLAGRAVAELLDQAARRRPGANMIGLEEGRMRLTPVEDFPRLVDLEHRRPADQWWMGLRGLVHELSHAPT